MREHEVGCPCRSIHHPATLDIAPGLSLLPRRIAGFGEFRRAMLSDASRRRALDSWTAREAGDLGVLLVEMWALACGIVAFADETISHECYIRTARRDRSLHDLIGRLGYRPRPAVAATVHLSIEASGRDTVTVAAGTAFRSGEVGDEPPQVFEALADTAVHPLVSKLTVPRRRLRRLGDLVTAGAGAPGSGSAGSTVELAEVTALVEGVGLAEGAPVRIVAGSSTSYRRIASVARVRGPGPKRSIIAFDSPLVLDSAIEWEQVKVQVADRSNLLWSLMVTGYSQPAISTSGGVTTLTLDGRYRQIAAGEALVLDRAGKMRWFTVVSSADATRTISPAVTFNTDDGPQTIAGATTTVTTLVLDTTINAASRRTDPTDTVNWVAGDAPDIVVRSGWRTAATLEAPIETEVSSDSSEPLSVGAALDRPWQEHQPERFVVVDRDGRAVTAEGALDWTTGEVTLDGASWDPPLRHPIRVEANVVTATRGESVRGEVLGSGDASRAGQVFRLANGPLTHLGPSAAGGEEVAVSTLVVWVDRVRWTEVAHFVGCGPHDRVYATRLTDDGGTEVVFGDGVGGSRLPTGTDNVVADYRWGAGAVHPPARSIAQLVEPVDNVTAVVNRSPAFGGADPESANEIRTNAPRSAVLLGRIVSRHDAAAAARAVPGVRVVSADWDWQLDRLRAGILVRYVGDAGLEEGVRRRLRALAERDVLIDVVVSPPQPVAVTVHVVADPRRLRVDVEAAVRAALVGEGGALTPEVLGIDGPLFRSRLMAAAVAADGVEAVTGAMVDGAVFDAVAVVPPPGWHLDGTADLTVVLEDPSHV